MEAKDAVTIKSSLHLERKEQIATEMDADDEEDGEDDEEEGTRGVPLKRPTSPLSSYASLKSDRSMAEPPKFSENGEINLRCSENEKFRGAASPQQSFVSFKSDRSMAEPPKFSENGEINLRCSENEKFSDAASPQQTFVSFKSDRSMAEPPKFRLSEEEREAFSLPSCVSLKSHRSMAEPPKFSEEPPSSPPSSKTEQQSEEPYLERSLEALETLKNNHRTSMKRKYESLCEGVGSQSSKTLLSQIYTQLFITTGEREAVNEEHEIVQIERAKSERLQGIPIHCNQIFQPSLETDQERGALKTVLTTGIAGIGKTVSVQKFILDWADRTANQDVDFLFFLPFRELNLLDDGRYGLHQLLLSFHPDLLPVDAKMFDSCKVLLIFDGLDESRFELEFPAREKVLDVSTPASVRTLLSNLIRGDLLPSALLWITSRPSAAHQIPSLHINRVTEVQGFSNAQKEEYFLRRIPDEHQARTIISHIKAVRSLHIMCHIPVFCWISSTVLQNILKQDNQAEIPKTLTEMYIHFLNIQMAMKSHKYGDDGQAGDPKFLLASNREVILKLAKLAFKAQMSGGVLFYEEDLEKFEVDVKDVSVYSGFCTEIFNAESVIFSRSVYCFVHLSFQEFFAALYAFSSYADKNMSVLKLFHKRKGRGKSRSQPEASSLEVFLKGVIDKALKSKNGHLDLFLRFLHGIALDSNQGLLKGLLQHTESNPESMKNVIRNLRQSQKQNVSPERWLNLSHCLIEMKDASILDEVQAILSSESHRKCLSSAHCSAIANTLLMAENVLEEFKPRTYSTTSVEAQRRLIPAVRVCRKALLEGCNLTAPSCEIVASALQAADSPVMELDMSDNDILDAGAKTLSVGLRSPNCKLEVLRLRCCKLSTRACGSVASALRSEACVLRELDISANDLQDPGVELLSAGLESPHCRLEVLRLASSKLTAVSCEALARLLQTGKLCLRELELSSNPLKDSGLKHLTAGLKSSKCLLEKLRLASCDLTGESCDLIGSLLQSEKCLLKELDLSNNNLQDSGVALLSSGLKSSHCKLQVLRLALCNLTDALVLQLNSGLRELNLSKNDLQDSGAEMLSEALKSSHCKLEVLRLSGCFITEKGCFYLTLALKSNPGHLRELDLTCNQPGEASAKHLSGLLNDPACKLEILKLEHEGKFRIKAGLRRCACDLSLDADTAHNHLSLSHDLRSVTHVDRSQSHPDHPGRFDSCLQVLCCESLLTRCFWELEWSGTDGVSVSVSYPTVRRKGESRECEFGCDGRSWRLVCSDGGFVAWHDNHKVKIRPTSSSSRTRRVGVYLDWPAGLLSFYSLSDGQHVTHLHTFHAVFSQPVFAGFALVPGSSVSLCDAGSSTGLGRSRI